MTDAAGRTGEDAVPAGDVVNQVEGYLLWQARIAEAEERARAFTEPLEWLTTAQREQIEEHYVRDCLNRAKADLQRVADRCRALRGEYEERYRQLRARCLAFLIAAVAVVAAATLLAVAVTQS